MFGPLRPKHPIEERYRKTFGLLAGVDEVGRGALAGPVVAAAVILPEDFDHPELNDSKCLSPAKREELYEIIISKAVSWGISQVENAEIDEIGILKASLKAMALALESLSPPPQLALIDGRFTTPWTGLQKAIIDGDALCRSIAAASIVAKVFRDRLMIKAAEAFPQYGFERHKGYGTREHLEALRTYGPCPIHRFSFRPVAETQRPEELRDTRRRFGRLVPSP